MTPHFYEISEFAEHFKVGTTTIYAQIKAGKLRLTKLGRKSLISHADAMAWATSLQTSI